MIGYEDLACRIGTRGGGYHYRPSNDGPEYEWSYFSFSFILNSFKIKFYYYI